MTDTLMDETRMLLCRVGTRFCALPVTHVVETMRPLQVEPCAGMPSFIRGLSIIRGVPIPVVDPSSLLGISGDAQPARFVAVRAGERRVALMVEEVLGIREIPAGLIQGLPPLLGDASVAVVSAIGILDADFLVVLHAARVVPESAWQVLETAWKPA